jgi:protein-disulfide isomerase
MKNALALAAALTMLACSSTRAQQPSGSDVVARVGDRAITLQELEDRWAKSDPAEHAEATQKVYDGRRAALDAIVADMVIAEAAKAKGLSADAYLEAEVDKRAKPVSDGEVVTFYQQNQNQMQGRSLEAIAPVIKRFLEEQQRTKARQDLVAELRKSAPAVRVMLDAPRRDVQIDASDPVIGTQNAAVTIVEFSDFQCPYCLRAAPTLKKLRDAYGDRVRVVWKDFPLTQIHPQAFKAAEAARCAADQGKFWEFHDQLFGNQQALQPDDLKRYAATMGLDATKFNECLDSSKFAERVRSGVAMGTRLGVNSTPTMYVNGRLVSGAQPYEVFTGIIDEELARSGKK